MRTQGGGDIGCRNCRSLSLRHRPGGGGGYMVSQLSQPLVGTRPRVVGHTWCCNCRSLFGPGRGDIHGVATVAASPCDKGQGGGHTRCRNCHSLLLRHSPGWGDIYGVATVAAYPCYRVGDIQQRPGWGHTWCHKCHNYRSLLLRHGQVWGTYTVSSCCDTAPG